MSSSIFGNLLEHVSLPSIVQILLEALGYRVNDEQDPLPVGVVSAIQVVCRAEAVALGSSPSAVISSLGVIVIPSSREAAIAVAFTERTFS